MPVYAEKKKVNRQTQWYIRTYVTDENGNSKQITRHNKLWLGKNGFWLATQEENRLKNNILILSHDLSLGQACNDYIEEKRKTCKDSTCYSREGIIENHIIPFFKRDSSTNKVTHKDIIRWKDYMDKKGLDTKYKNECLRTLSGIYQSAVNNGKLENNPVKKVSIFQNTIEDKKKKKQKEIRYITLDQFNRFIANVDIPIWYTYFIILYYTGMRKGEVQALTWENVDFENKKIFVKFNLTVKTKESVYKIVETKNYKRREVDMSKRLYNTLLEYYNLISKEKSFKKTDFVLGGERPLAQTSIDRKKKEYFDLCDVNEITNQEFRHSHVSLLINEYIKSGETDTTKFFIMASNRLGHSIEVMIDTYLHLFPNVQESIVNLLDNLDAEQDQKQDQKNQNPLFSRLQVA